MANYNFNVGTSAGGSGNITTFTQGDTITFNVGTQGANWTLGLGRSSDAFITSWTGGSGSSGTWNSSPSGGGVATLNSNGTGFKVPIANSNSYALGGTVTLFKDGNSHFTVTIGRVKDTTTVGVSGTINYSNATVAIGSTFTVTVSGNASNGSYSYNQNGGSTNNRFTPAPASYAVTGSAPGNQFTATAIDPAGGLNSNGAATGFYNLKVGSLGVGTTIDTGPNKVIYKPVVSPSPSIALTTNNQVDGSWEVTLSESGGTTNGGSSTQFRFINGSNVELQGWSTDNTYSNIGSTRPISIKGQIREVGVYNTSTSAETGLVSVPTIAADTVFSVSGPSTITSGAGSFTVNISGASQNDEIRVVLNGTNTQLVGFTTVPASGALSLSCTASSANFPSGTAVSVSCQVRRPSAVGGTNSSTGGIGAFNVTRQAAPDGSITVNWTDGNGTNINGSGFYNSADGNVTATISSGSSGTQYRLATTSGSASPSGTVINGINFGTRTGNGAITVSVQLGTQGSQIQGDQVGYRVQYREINTSTWFNATGTGAIFTLTHTVANSQAPIVFGLGNQAPTDSITVQEAFSNPPPTDCIVEFNQAGGAFTVASGSPRVVTGYSQNRGTTVAYGSRFRNSTTGVVSFFTPNVSNYSLGYLAGFDNGITVTPSSYTVNSTSAGATGDLTFSYTGGSSNTEYRLVSTSVAGTIDTDSGASGSFLVDYSNNEIPPDGSTYTYTFEGRRTAATGGDPSGAYQAAAAGTASVSIQRLNLTAPDRAITVNGNAPASPTTTSAFTKVLTGNTYSANAQTTDTISIVGAQIGDEIRVIKDATGTLLVDFFTITTPNFNISVPTSTGAFAAGTSELVKVQIRRPNSSNGDNVNGTALSYTYSRALNQATARLLTSGGTSDITFGATSTIGATAYIAAANGSTGADTAMDLVVSSGSASGTDYRIKVTSGTTNAGDGAGTGFTPFTATTTSFTTFLAESRLPNVNASVGYIIEARDNSSTGDGVWYECFRTAGGALASFTVTRSNYVSPDTTTGPFVVSGVTATQSANTYVIGFNDSANKSYTIASTETNQVYIVEEGGSTYASFGTGNSSLSGTILNSDIPTGSSWSGFLRTAVPISQNGDGIYVSCTETGGSPLIFAFVSQENALVTPGILSLGSNMKSGDLTKIVPWVRLTDTAADSNLGGLREFAWSTTDSTPDGWFQPSVGQVAGYNTANFSLNKFTTGATTASYTVYFGVRNKSEATGDTTTPNYGSVVVNGSSFVVVPGGLNADGYLNQVNEGGGGGYIVNGTDEITLQAAETTTNETVLFESLTDPASVSVVSEGDYNNSILPISSVAVKTLYRLEVSGGTTQNGSVAGALLEQQFLPVSATSITQTILNPSELPTTGNTTDYKFYRQQTKAQGGDDTKQAPNNAATRAEFSARRLQSAQGNVTISVPETQFYNQVATFQTISLAGGNSNTEYQIIVTAGSPNTPVSPNPVAGPTTADASGNASFSLNPSLDVPEEGGDIVEYQVQFRQVGSAAAFANCTGTNTLFKLAALDADSIILSDGVPNGDRATNTTYDTSPLTINGIASTQTFSISGTSAQFKVNSGTMDATNKSVSEGDTIVVRLTTSGVENTARTATLGFPGLTSNTKTWTLTTGTNTGTGTGGGGPGGGSGTYGLEIYNSLGNSLIDQNSRVARAVSNGVISSLAGGGTTSSAISVTGLTNTDDWTIVVTVALTPLAAGQPSKFSVNKGTGSFTITNNTEEQEPSSNDDQRRFYWWAFKSA